MKPGPTIAFLLSELTGNYQCAVASALQRGLQKRGWGSVWFLGWPLVVPFRPVRSDNPTLDLLCQGRPAGILTTQGSMAQFVSPAGYQKLAKSQPEVPLVALSAPLDGHTSVLMMNRESIREIVVHLADVHHCRHIGFLRGPSDQADSQERYQGYQDALANRGWAVDPSLVLDGAFDAIRAEQAVSGWLDRPHPRMDALVCANDDMAAGAILAFSKRGIRVPQDILVTGFDAWETPVQPSSLTSIRQPVETLVDAALDALTREMENPGSSPKTVRLPCQMILGASCGCVSGPRPLPSPPEGLTEALLAALQRKDEQREIAPLFLPLAQGPRPTAALMAVLLDLRTRFFSDAPDLGRVSDLAALGAELIEEVLERRRTAAGRQAIGLQTCAAALLTSQDWDELTSALLSFFPQLGLRTFYFSLYETPVIENPEGGGPALPPSRLLLAVEQGISIFSPPGSLVFPSGDLVPPALLDLWGRHGRTFLFLPLAVRHEHFGGLVVEYLLPSDSIYEVLRSTLSNAVKLILAKQNGTVP